MKDHPQNCACDAHEHFLAGLTAAPQDISMPVLEQFLADGYVDYQWNTSPSATDSACLMLDGDRGNLADLIEGGRQYSAPFYQKTHVGCHCSITISGPSLPDVVVTAFGVQ